MRIGAFFGTQVAREDGRRGAAGVGQRQVDAGRAEHVTGFDPASRHAGSHLHRVVIRNGTELGHHGFHVFHAVQRLDQLLSGPLAAAIDAFDVLGLDLGRVAEDQVRQFAGRRRAEDGAVAAGFDQQRQAARVVQVGMGQQHGVQFAGIQVARHAIPLLRFGHALKQAEIDQDAGLLRLDQISRTGDVAAGSTV